MIDSSVSIRVLTPDDAEEFRAVRSEGLRRYPHAFGEPIARFKQKSLEDVRRRICDPAQPDNRIFGAFVEDRLAGTAGLIRWEEAGPDIGMIWGMYVRTEFQRRGIGRMLIHAAIQCATEELCLTELQLGVSERSDSARALYQEFGFEVFRTDAGAIKHVDGGLCEHWMVKKLRA